MKTVLLTLLWLATIAWGGLGKYPQLVVADPAGAPAPTRGVRVTYLGTNGYVFESRGTTLLIDPYFTRRALLPIGLNLRLQPSEARLAWAVSRLPAKVDAILVTHGHFDHLLDVPPLARRYGAEVIASPTSVFLAQAAGTEKTRAVLPGAILRVGGARIRVLAASHDCILGRVPFPGKRSAVPAPPRRPSDWVCGEPLAFLIEMGGKRIYVDSGGTPSVLPPANLGRVDLAIVGVALRDSRDRLPMALDRLRPRFFLPSHQDHFFRPLHCGFVFGPLTDFPRVLRDSQSNRLILLDYFRPWTLR